MPRPNNVNRADAEKAGPILQSFAHYHLDEAMKAYHADDLDAYAEHVRKAQAFQTAGVELSEWVFNALSEAIADA